jgi:sodium-dependent dicarboxylate transporter 2/3/5
MAVFKPERKTIPGLKARAQDLACRLGPMSRPEILTVLIVVSTIVLLCLHAFIPRWQTLDRTGIMLAAALTFFLFKILSLQDLEEIPWNILLLFGGAISAGFCLWQTGAANWLAVQWLAAFHQAPGFVFILSVGCFILVITNVIVNVAALAFTLPVALAIAPYLGVAPEAVFFTCLAASGMPFLLLIGAAPNAIAFESRQFTAVEFLKIGLPATLILLAVLSLFVALFWPLMGLEVMVKP